MKKHHHKAIRGRSKDKCWTACVTPQQCASTPLRQAAHGNIVRVDTCSCGAQRETEINAGLKNFGAWGLPYTD